MKPAGIIAVCKMSVPEVFHHVELLAPAAIRGKRYLYIPGSPILPLLIAHADTVHENLPKLILYDAKRNALSSPQGVGADDRAGVYAVLQLWEAARVKPGLLICDEEEWGALGAEDAARDLKKELAVYPFLLEIDRKGKGEAVFYNDEPSFFRLFIKQFGFKDHHGLFSDISVLGEQLRKCSVNVSAGYYDCHTLKETLVLNHLDDTIKKVKRILADCLINPGRDFPLPILTRKQKRKKKRKSRWEDAGNVWTEDGSRVAWGPDYRAGRGFLDLRSSELNDRAIADAYFEKHVIDPSYDYAICDFCGVQSGVSDTHYGRVCAECYSMAELGK